MLKWRFEKKWRKFSQRLSSVQGFCCWIESSRWVQIFVYLLIYLFKAISFAETIIGEWEKCLRINLLSSVSIYNVISLNFNCFPINISKALKIQTQFIENDPIYWNNSTNLIAKRKRFNQQPLVCSWISI